MMLAIPPPEQSVPPFVGFSPSKPTREISDFVVRAQRRQAVSFPILRSSLLYTFPLYLPAGTLVFRVGTFDSKIERLSCGDILGDERLAMEGPRETKRQGVRKN